MRPSLRFHQGRGPCLALNNLRCTVPSPLFLQQTEAHSLHSVPICSASCSGLGLRNSLAFHLPGQSAQLHWVEANLTLSPFPLLTGQLHTGSLPSTPSMPSMAPLLKSLFRCLHCSIESLSGLPYMLSLPKSQESPVVRAAHGQPLPPDPGADSIPLSLPGTLPVGTCCCNYGCAACYVCV